MKAYTQDDIENLIGCPKTILEPPRRELKLIGADWRNDMKLESGEIEGNFSVFMRRSEDFPENFSIGLIYDPKDGTGEITLIRCNGPHGVFGGVLDPEHPHWGFHIHMASEEAINAGLRPEKHAQKTSEYASYDACLQFFLHRINLDVDESKKYFPNKSQEALPFEEDSSYGNS